jgi:hypothetical protein
VDRDPSDLQPAFLIARGLGVSRQLVYWWVRAGKLKKAGTAADGRPLYSYRAAARVDSQTSRSPLSHRATSAA